MHVALLACAWQNRASEKPASMTAGLGQSTQRAHRRAMEAPRLLATAYFPTLSFESLSQKRTITIIQLGNADDISAVCRPVGMLSVTV